VDPRKPEKLSPWLLTLRPAWNTRAQVFFFPYAGGSGQMYRGLTRALAPDLGAFAVELPGRGDRYGEKRFDRLTALVPVLMEKVSPFFVPPFAFFGHSMGATIAFELARELKRAGLPLPVRLFASARRAPHLPGASEQFHALSDAAFKKRLRTLGGTPAEVLENEELLEVVMPTLRADFALSETYAHVPAAPLDLPISMFGGSGDPEATREELEPWAEHSSRDSRLRIFPGNHFFIHSNAEAVMQAVNEDLSDAGVPTVTSARSGW
jgi:medium-chain acyl-[acyl-carrier-protein] hydrolase